MGLKSQPYQDIPLILIQIYRLTHGVVVNPFLIVCIRTLKIINTIILCVPYTLFAIEQKIISISHTDLEN